MEVTVSLVRAAHRARVMRSASGVDDNDNRVDEAVLQRLLIFLLLHASSDQQVSKTV